MYAAPHPLPSRGQAALRRGRVSTAGQVYLVTTIARDRCPMFRDWDLASAAARVTLDRNVVGNSHLLAWVLMPDHFHALLVLGENDSLSAVIRRLKGNMALKTNQARRATGAVWQHGFHDHAVRREVDLETLARYVIENPVRAGLVARSDDYPFWNMEWL